MSLPRPNGYVPPPRPRLADAIRTARAIATDFVPYLVRLAVRTGSSTISTTNDEGLAVVGEAFAATLARLGVVLEVHRADRVPREGGLVFMWNQESHLDHLVLPPAIPRPFFSLYNNAVARVPFYGANMRATGHVHIDRNDEAQWRPAVARAADRVRGGECVLVSPEGTRSWDGRLLPMKRGALLLAVQSERPVVCVTIVGGHERMPRGSAVVRAGPMRVVFSDPIEPRHEPEALGAEIVRVFESIKHVHALGSRERA